MGDEMTVDWSLAPEWANSVVVDVMGNYFWIEAWGENTKRQEFGLNSAENVTADTSGSQTNWRLASRR